MQNTEKKRKKDNRRKKILIEPNRQLKSALTVIISMVSYSLLLGFIVFFPLYLEMDASENLEQLEWISTLVLQLHQRLWPAVIIVSIAMGIQSIYSSHRIIGPAYQLRKNIREFIQGNFVTTKLRKRDHLREVELVLNELGNKLTKITRSGEEFHAYIRDELISISLTLEKNDGRGSDQTLKTLHHLVEKLENHTSGFTSALSPSPTENNHRTGSPV
ncbi:MAG: hypothetical protein ABGX83_02115 [Nitrospira sp.]|nr:hypothetical protein [Candidatus Manganitrophaceae bacterium]HIL34509.1 hypothetical protein [Candidatus Manganitrophaceae bacterium]